MKKDLIQKIQKLLALANSDNENEAKLASKRAQELLLKHNISMATVENAQFEFIEHAEELKRQPVEAKFIHSILLDFFFVKIIHSKREQKLIFVGTEENVQVAMYVRGFLKESFKRLYKAEAEAQGWKSGANRNAFYLGVYKGLSDQLTEQKQAAQNSNTKAMVAIDKALVDYLHSAHKGLKKRSAGAVRGNKDAVDAGIERGRNLRIARGIGSKNQSSKTLSIGGKQ